MEGRICYNLCMTDTPASVQIDDIIALHGGWKSDVLTQLREVITDTDERIVEEVKWKMKTRPEGLPVWSYEGILCFAEIWKDNIKLIFHKGSSLPDPDKLFNARLKSADVRAIEIHEGEEIRKSGIQALVNAAVAYNLNKTSR